MLKIAACDDEPQELKRIDGLLKEYGETHGIALKAAAFCSAKVLLSELEDGHAFDLYLLDILMPGMTGMELAKAIRRQNHAAQIAFLTSSPEYALESYSVDACGYLLKPVQRAPLSALLEKVLLLCGRQERESLLLSDNGILCTVPLSAIECAEVQYGKLLYHLHNGKTVETGGTMNELEKQFLSRPNFIKPHRSYIVNMMYIQSFGSREIQLTGPFPTVPVSRKLYQQLKVQYLEYMTHMAGGKKS